MPYTKKQKAVFAIKEKQGEKVPPDWRTAKTKPEPKAKKRVRK